MTTATVDYRGGLRCILTHSESGTAIHTDAPRDNNGQGAAFSPTDLLATSLAACALTIMGIKAQAMGVVLEGARAEVHKDMAANPRRVARVQVDFYLCGDYDEHTRQMLEAAARSCPVAQSLSADVVQELVFHYTL
ncbi:putative OsmC-like protein [Neisseria sp. HSC-16F19]|nr:OsmC family protein [Neisseria sp. HSC-16F19]MCP2040976.1 putative OsmC-like protein [Neisseria sp. HSC-16F19]